MCNGVLFWVTGSAAWSCQEHADPAVMVATLSFVGSTFAATPDCSVLEISMGGGLIAFSMHLAGLLLDAEASVMTPSSVGFLAGIERSFVAYGHDSTYSNHYSFRSLACKLWLA